MKNDALIQAFLATAGAIIGVMAVLSFLVTVVSIRAHRGPTAALAGATTVFAVVGSLLLFLLYDSLTRL